ncbi:hypothetical protein V1264_022560 [Littorina saxatilis]|uniref:[histone H4]-lysine(20) N-methyltransferase n=1 Tax=Littorina saxatilis TaxID=31220 RepID=A0AAN9AKQ5_9CAEN
MAEVSARSKTPVSRITDFFPNGDCPGATSPSPRASSATSATGPKKPRKRGARTKSAAAKSGKGSAVTTDADATTVSSTAAVPTKTKAVPSKGKPAAKASKEPENDDTPQKQITSFFPVRRSSRQGMTSRQLKRAREKEMAEKIKTGCEDGLEVVEFEGKGRGVVATKSFEKDDFVVEYCGDLVNITTAKQREQLYERDEEVGCYMYYFNHKNKQYCIDATTESGKLGRLLNHSRKGNCHTKAVTVGDRPYLILVASQHIEKGEELTYDYGDRSQKALESHPWLKA